MLHMFAQCALPRKHQNSTIWGATRRAAASLVWRSSGLPRVVAPSPRLLEITQLAESREAPLTIVEGGSAAGIEVESAAIEVGECTRLRRGVRCVHDDLAG